LTTGRVVKGISLNFDHSGQMNSFGRVGFSATWAGFWGYPAPGLLGLVLITSAVFGWAPLALSLGALVLLVALIFIRNLAGAVIGMGLGIGSLKDLVKVIRVHTRRRRVQQSDAYILAQGSRLPAGAWLTLFAFVIIVCALASARVLYSAVTIGPV